ncbi:type II secretion system F family protein [Porticoccaceae bacterium]|nr:type II secretion system F family protein [Porticoccaceae bacterium]
MATSTSQQRYSYRGRDRSGRVLNGEITAANSAEARNLLRRQGVLTTKLKRHRQSIFTSRAKSIKASDIAILTRQLATMMRAGIPLVQSFDVVADGLDNPSLARVVRQLRDDVSAGSSFTQALQKHPKLFDPLYCNLIAAGESSGSLETMLSRVATYREKTEQLKAKIKKALAYPVFVVLVAVVVTSILLIKVVPVFAETFASFGAELPPFTRMVMSLSEWLQQSWWGVALFSAFFVWVFNTARRRSAHAAYILDQLILKLPIVGPILEKAIVARFSRTLATTFAAGVPLVEALESVAEAAGNLHYRNHILLIREDVTTGIALHRAVRSRQIFPSLLEQMTAIGEESGALDEMLEKTAEHFEQSVDNSVDSLTALLEPMIMAVLGIVVGGLLFAMYLPIFQLGSIV